MVSPSQATASKHCCLTQALASRVSSARFSVNALWLLQKSGCHVQHHPAEAGRPLSRWSAYRRQHTPSCAASLQCQQRTCSIAAAANESRCLSQLSAHDRCAAACPSTTCAREASTGGAGCSGASTRQPRTSMWRRPPAWLVRKLQRTGTPQICRHACPLSCSVMPAVASSRRGVASNAAASHPTSNQPVIAPSAAPRSLRLFPPPSSPCRPCVPPAPGSAAAPRQWPRRPR